VCSRRAARRRPRAGARRRRRAAGAAAPAAAREGRALQTSLHHIASPAVTPHRFPPSPACLRRGLQLKGTSGCCKRAASSGGSATEVVSSSHRSLPSQEAGPLPGASSFQCAARRHGQSVLGDLRRLSLSRPSGNPVLVGLCLERSTRLRLVCSTSAPHEPLRSARGQRWTSLSRATTSRFSSCWTLWREPGRRWSFGACTSTRTHRCRPTRSRRPPGRCT